MGAAVTVRDAQGVLLCFGPENGQYDPQVRPGQIRRIEPDYDAVLAEWAASQVIRPSPKDKALADVRVPAWFKEWLTESR